METDRRVDLALEWLVNSDIRYPDNDSRFSGSYINGYNWKHHFYPYIYCEITGYAISTLVNFYRWTGQESYLDLAGQSANFLMGVQGLVNQGHLRGAISHGYSLPELDLNRQYYSFDSAMCLQGLLDLYNINPSSVLLESAQSLGDWLVDHMQQEDGSFLSMFDETTDEKHHVNEDFFGDRGSLHAKHTIGLLKLWKATGNQRYHDAAQRVSDWVIRLQNEDGSIRATEYQEQVVSHPHCYATEGLLYSYYATGSERYLEAARKAGEWLFKIQNRDGSINITYKRKWWRLGRRITEIVFPRRVTDATAQSVRIWLLLFYIYGDSRFLEAAGRAVEFLSGMQCLSSSDKNAPGGFYFWSGHPMMFTWCTMFAIHAIYAYNHMERGEGLVSLMEELF